MAKVRSLKYIKQEIEKVEASIRKHAKGTKVAKKKQRVLNVLQKMKTTLARECDPEVPPSFSPMGSEEGAAMLSARKTIKKKASKKK